VDFLLVSNISDLEIRLKMPKAIRKEFKPSREFLERYRVEFVSQDGWQRPLYEEELCQVFAREEDPLNRGSAGVGGEEVWLDWLGLGQR